MSLCRLCALRLIGLIHSDTLRSQMSVRKFSPVFGWHTSHTGWSSSVGFSQTFSQSMSCWDILLLRA